MKNLLALVLVLGFFLFGGALDSVSSPLTESNDIVQVGDQFNVHCFVALSVDNVFYIQGVSLSSLSYSYSYIAWEEVTIFQEATRNKGSGEAILSDDNVNEYKSYQVTTLHSNYLDGNYFVTDIIRFDLYHLIMGTGYLRPLLC